jgi:uncharacterized damage-inducible protein DinB
MNHELLHNPSPHHYLYFMKDYLIRLFEYDRYANLVILETIIKAGHPEKPVKLMAHLLAAQQVWLNRCKGLPATGGALWPDWPAETLEAVMLQNTGDWLAYLNDIQPADLEKPVSYKNSKGESFQNKLIDVLGHLINHGTHHRAQAGQHLILAGVEHLPNTDYIFFIRALNH